MRSRRNLAKKQKKRTYKNLMARRKPQRDIRYFPGCGYPETMCIAEHIWCPFAHITNTVLDRPSVPPYGEVSKQTDFNFSCQLAQQQVRNGVVGIPDGKRDNTLPDPPPPLHLEPGWKKKKPPKKRPLVRYDHLGNVMPKFVYFIRMNELPNEKSYPSYQARMTINGRQRWWTTRHTVEEAIEDVKKLQEMKDNAKGDVDE